MLRILIAIGLLVEALICEVEAMAMREVAPIGVPLTVNLRRATKPSADGIDKTFFVTTVVVGEANPGEQRQEFDVIFDLGSGQVVLPSVRCYSKACLDHRRYDKWASKRAVDINANGHPVLEHDQATPAPALRGDRSGSSPMHGKKVVRDLANIGVEFLDIGSGQVKGELIRDRFCLQSHGASDLRCLELGMIAATDMSDLPFSLMPNDGIVGLGLEALAIGHDFGFLGKLADRLPQLEDGGASSLMRFGLFLGNGTETGELVFGGYNAERLAASSTLSWAPVANPEKGFWQVSVVAVRLGNHTVDICGRRGPCLGAWETGASHFSVSPEIGESLQEAFRETGEMDEVVNADGEIKPVSKQGRYNFAPLELVLEGGTVLALPPEDYVANSACLTDPEACGQIVQRHAVPEPTGRWRWTPKILVW